MSTPFTAKDVQEYLGVETDGRWGKESRSAARRLLDHPKDGTNRPWGDKRLIHAVQQKMLNDKMGLKLEIDGLIGPRTENAFEQYQNAVKTGTDELKVTKSDLSWWEAVKAWWWDDDTPSEIEGDLPVEPPQTVEPNAKPSGPAVIKGKVQLRCNRWPLQRDVPAFFGKKGANQTRIQLPYTMKIAWDQDKKVNTIVCHKKVAGSLQRIFEAVYQEYGDEAIRDLGLDLYGGCLNVRKVRGGNTWSMHSWGIAVDMDPSRNAFRANHTKARLAKPDAARFWEIVEAEGWVSLGRERDFDWMHFQAARLR